MVLQDFQALPCVGRVWKSCLDALRAGNRFHPPVLKLLPPRWRPELPDLKVRILYLHQYFTTPAMSGGTRSYEMARRLVQAGHQVEMITSWREPVAGTSRPSRGWWVEEVDGIRVHWLPVAYDNRMGFLRRMAAFIHFALAAGHRAATLAADVVFATSTPLTIALPAAAAAGWQRIPMVLEVRDLWPAVPIALGILRGPAAVLARGLERFAYARAQAVVALSPGMAQGVSRCGYPPERIAMIPNSADRELFSVPASAGQDFRRRHPPLGNRPLVVYTGALGRANAVGFMVEMAAATRTLAPEIQFLVVGDGAERDTIAAAAAAHGLLGESFHMLPPCAKNAIPAILSAADLACSFLVNVPAVWENSPNKVFDALAAGCPVLINYPGWIGECLTTSGAGLVVSNTDPQAAARALVAFLADPEARARAQRAARTLAAGPFDRDRLAATLRQVLEQVADPARMSSP